MPRDPEDLFRQGQERLEQMLPSGGRVGRRARIAAIALVALAAWTAFYTVPSDSVAVVQRFGRYLKDVRPGCTSSCPSASTSSTIVPVKRQLKQEFGFATPGATNPWQTTRATAGGKRRWSPAI